MDRLCPGSSVKTITGNIIMSRTDDILLALNHQHVVTFSKCFQTLTGKILIFRLECLVTAGMWRCQMSALTWSSACHKQLFLQAVVYFHN